MRCGMGRLASLYGTLGWLMTDCAMSRQLNNKKRGIIYGNLGAMLLNVHEKRVGAPQAGESFTQHASSNRVFALEQYLNIVLEIIHH